MKCIPVILLILTLLCQLSTSQASSMNIVKSTNLKVDKKAYLSSRKTGETLISQLRVPKDYEFRIQVVKGAKDITVEKDDLGYAHERYAQYYKGIKIEHSDIRAHYLNDTLISFNGEYIDALSIDISVAFSKEIAIKKAKEHISAKQYMWEDETESSKIKSVTDDKTISFYPNSEIVICKNSLDIQDTTFHIAYKIDIFAKEPLRHDYVYVDAKSGSILAVTPILINAMIDGYEGVAETRYSGTRIILTQQAGARYHLRCGYLGTKIETYNLYSHTDTVFAFNFGDSDNNWTAAEFHNTWKHDGALDAHWGALMTNVYFYHYHGRKSFDNNYGTLKSYVHYGTNYANAGWNTMHKYVFYGDGNNTTFDILTSIDLVAHEIGHGLCQFSANLVYQGESGAINESLSDIWAACVENDVTNMFSLNKQIWLLGEDVVLQGAASRSMSNPKTFGQPNTYGGTYWANPTSYSDYGGVHTNSGIMNYWFYLLSVGGSGTNDKGDFYYIRGISIDKAANIVYRAETVYMTASTNFTNARAYTIQAAIDLYGDDGSEVINTTNAWHAVGMGNHFACPSSTLGNPTVFANQIVTTNTTVTNCGDINVQNVNVQSGAKLTLYAAGTTVINGDFGVALGSELEIK